MYNILLGGAAGDGIETMSALLEKMLKQSGCHLFTIRDFMSRVRGGHNFTQIRFGDQPLDAHRDSLDGIFAIDETTYREHQPQLTYDGFILCDESLPIDDFRAIKLPLKAIATELGNPKVISSVATGALLKLFNIPLTHAAAIIQAELRADLAEINIAALNRGYDLVDANYEVPLSQTSEHLLLSGNTAIGLGAVAAGLKFYSAYPMSPSTSLLDFFNAHSSTMAIAVEQDDMQSLEALAKAINRDVADIDAVHGEALAWAQQMTEAAA